MKTYILCVKAEGQCNDLYIYIITYTYPALFSLLQGPHLPQATYAELGKRYGMEGNLPDTVLQEQLEDVRDHLKREIRKELKEEKKADKGKGSRH